MKSLKKYFISGLLFLLPISLSIWILYKVFNFLEGIVGHFVKEYFPYLYTPGIGFFSLLLLILILGFFAQNFIGKKLIHSVEKIFESVPFLNKIFLFIKSLIQNVLNSDKHIFKEAVKIEFFSNSFTIGFVTGETVQKENGEKYFNIFVPTVPNITTGFYLIVPEKKVEKLNISVEDALKLVVSMGILKPENGSNKNGSNCS